VTTHAGEHGPAVPEQGRGAVADGQAQLHESGQPRASQGQVDRAHAEAAPREAKENRMDEAVDQPTEGDADGRLAEAVEAAAILAEETGGLGTPGRPLNRRSPFYIGMAATAGVAVTFGLVELLIKARSVLVLIGLALFIAAGLDPAVGWLTRHGLKRWQAVLVTIGVLIAVIGGFLAAAIPPLATQATNLADQLPNYLHTLQNHNSQLGKLDAQYHIQDRLKALLTSKGGSLVGGVLGAGELVIGTVSSFLVVAVLAIYFLADMPRIKLLAYRLAPHSRRARVILIGDEIFAKVGGFVLGNFVTSVIAGLGTFLWMIAFGLPYPILLGLLVAFLDLIPVIGSTVGGAIVTLIGLTVSLPIALATLGFYIAYRLAEDYLVVPRVMGRAVQVPGAVSVVAVLVGGALMGIIGALVAIPAAAALRLLLEEVAFRRLDDA
jgi:predicted PurR-regulated permease PerM